MTLCEHCLIIAPPWVDTSKPIDDESLPKPHCEICKKTEKELQCPT